MGGVYRAGTQIGSRGGSRGFKFLSYFFGLMMMIVILHVLESRHILGNYVYIVQYRYRKIWGQTFSVLGLYTPLINFCLLLIYNPNRSLHTYLTHG